MKSIAPVDDEENADKELLEMLKKQKKRKKKSRRQRQSMSRRKSRSREPRSRETRQGSQKKSLLVRLENLQGAWRPTAGPNAVIDVPSMTIQFIGFDESHPIRKAGITYVADIGGELKEMDIKKCNRNLIAWTDGDTWERVGVKKNAKPKMVHYHSVITPDLPPGWEMVWSQSQQAYYYYHPGTGTSTWSVDGCFGMASAVGEEDTPLETPAFKRQATAYRKPQVNRMDSHHRKHNTIMAAAMMMSTVSDTCSNANPFEMMPDPNGLRISDLYPNPRRDSLETMSSERSYAMKTVTGEPLRFSPLFYPELGAQQTDRSGVVRDHAQTLAGKLGLKRRGVIKG